MVRAGMATGTGTQAGTTIRAGTTAGTTTRVDTITMRAAITAIQGIGTPRAGLATVAISRREWTDNGAERGASEERRTGRAGPTASGVSNGPAASSHVGPANPSAISEWGDARRPGRGLSTR